MLVVSRIFYYDRGAGGDDVPIAAQYYLLKGGETMTENSPKIARTIESSARRVGAIHGIDIRVENPDRPSCSLLIRNPLAGWEFRVNLPEDTLRYQTSIGLQDFVIDAMNRQGYPVSIFARFSMGESK